jgi:hypothetical protein
MSELMPQHPMVAKYAAFIDNAVLNAIIAEENEGGEEMWERIEQNEENLAAFLHAFSSLVPARFYEAATGNKTDALTFNHTANRLCFRFCRPHPLNLPETGATV